MCGGDHELPSVNVHDAKATELGETPLELTMEFHDSTVLNIAEIEAQPLTAMKWRGMTFKIEGIRLDVTAKLSVGARLRIKDSSDIFHCDQIEEIERNILEGGIEEFALCLVDNVEQSDIRCLSVIAERW